MKAVSLFSGIGGFDLAFQRAGIEIVAQVEIDPACRSVLRLHDPDIQRFSDVREVGAQNLPACDVVCGGFPCQDLSVAGKRMGFAGVRSSLFFEMVRIVNELKPAFLVWENVPGLLSANHGRDFAAVLMALDAIGYSGAWTMLDAQFFGLAQRRRRLFGVFARADIGAKPCAEILSFFARMSGDTPPGAGQRPAVADTIRGGASGGSSYGKQSGSDKMTMVVTAPPISKTLGSHHGRNDLDSMGSYISCSSKDDGRDASVDISPTLRSMNFPESHINGGGQIAIVQNQRGELRELGEVVGAINAEQGMNGQPFGVTAFNGYTGGADDNDAQAGHIITTGPLMSHSARHGHAMTTQQAAEAGLLVIAQNGSDVQVTDKPGALSAGHRGTNVDVVAYRTAGNCGPFEQGDKVACLATATDPNQNIIAFTERSRAEGRTLEAQTNLAYALTNPGSGGRTHSRQVAGERIGVRRLTPLECERLQGFPNGWTEFGMAESGKRIKQSDSVRYRQLGNAVAVPVVEWLARRLANVEENLNA